MLDHTAPAAGITFLTDDDIVRRARQIDNGLAHFEAIIPSMRREVQGIIDGLSPREPASSDSD